MSFPLSSSCIWNINGLLIGFMGIFVQVIWNSVELWNMEDIFFLSISFSSFSLHMGKSQIQPPRFSPPSSTGHMWHRLPAEWRDDQSFPLLWCHMIAFEGQLFHALLCSMNVGIQFSRSVKCAGRAHTHVDGRVYWNMNVYVDIFWWRWLSGVSREWHTLWQMPTIGNTLFKWL